MSDLTLRQFWLGMTPYAVVELEADTAADNPNGFKISVTAGCGADESPTTLLVMAVTEAPPDGNPLAEMLRTRWLAAPGPAARSAVESVVVECNPAWLPYVTHEGT